MQGEKLSSKMFADIAELDLLSLHQNYILRISFIWGHSGYKAMNKTNVQEERTAIWEAVSQMAFHHQLGQQHGWKGNDSRDHRKMEIPEGRMHMVSGQERCILKPR